MLRESGDDDAWRVPAVFIFETSLEADVVAHFPLTGVAGPQPGEDGNPSGLVHLAAACRDGRVSHVEQFSGCLIPTRIFILQPSGTGA